MCTLLCCCAGTLVGKTLMTAAQGIQYNSPSSLVSLDVFALQVREASLLALPMPACLTARSRGLRFGCAFLLLSSLVPRLHSRSQASTNILLCHLVGLAFGNLMMRIVNKAVPRTATA